MRIEKHIIKNRYSTHGIHRNIPVYEMNTVHCSASPIEGYKGTEVTLIDNAAWNEKFSAWALTGATATGNNIVLNNDVTAQGIYETAKNVTLQTDGGGTINSTKMSGFIGDQATLSNTPDATHVFSGYTITGATLTGSNFNFIGNDVTAKAWFKYFNTPLYTADEIDSSHSPNIYLADYTDFVVIKFDEVMNIATYRGTPAITPFRLSANNSIISFDNTITMEGSNWPATGVWPSLDAYHKFPGGTASGDYIAYVQNFNNEGITAVTSGTQHTLEYVKNEPVTVKFIASLNNRTIAINQQYPDTFTVYCKPDMSAFISSYMGDRPVARYSFGTCTWTGTTGLSAQLPNINKFRRVRIDGASTYGDGYYGRMLNYSVSTADTLEHALAI